MKKIGTGVWLVSDTVMEELGVDHDGPATITRSAVHIGGQPHRRTYNLTVASLYDAMDTTFLEVLAARQEKVTVLTVGPSGSAQAIEGRLTFHTVTNKPFLMKKGSNARGWQLDQLKLREVCVGYSMQGAIEHSWQVHAELIPQVRKVDIEGVPEYDEDREETLIHAVYLFDHPGFGRDAASATPGCLFLATDAQRPDPDELGARTIVNGYFWAPESSELVSEHGSHYLDELDRMGGRVVDFTPGWLTFTDCIKGLPGSTVVEVLDHVTHPQCAQCGVRIRRSPDPDVPWVHEGTGNMFCLVNGEIPMFVDQDDCRDIADPVLQPIPRNMHKAVIDEDCPACGYPERLTPVHDLGSRFGCPQCDYVSRERDA